MSEHSETIQIFVIVFSILLMLVLFLSKCLHDSPRLNRYLSEPAMTLLVGMVFGFLVSMVYVIKESGKDYYYDQNMPEEVEQDLAGSILGFQTKIFFLALLPPILFNSGYQLQRELFMRHITPISLFACLGTVLSGLVAGGILIGIRELGWFANSSFQPTDMELLTFGAMIAATDTVSVVGILQAKQVDPHLFSLVFGESALNDAVSLVLFKTFSMFLVNEASEDASSAWTGALKFAGHLAVQAVQATCSPLLGIFYCVLMALALRKAGLRQHPLLELSVYIMPMYIPYMISEALDLSGMIAIFFTGMFAKRYMEPNVSESTRQHSEMLFKLFAFLAETCIFLELGLSVFGQSGKFQWQFIGWAILAALVGRAASIYPLAACYNLSLTKVVKVPAVCGGGEECYGDAFGGGGLGVASGGGPSDNDGTLGKLDGSASTWSSRRETPQRRLDKRISLNFMHMLTFAGLRGAVAYACARDFPNVYGNRDSFVTTTMAIVLFTVIIMGGATQSLMETLKIRTGVDEQEYMRNWRSQRKLKGRFHSFEHQYLYGLAISQSFDDRSAVPGLGAIELCMTATRDNTTSRSGALLEDDAFDYKEMVDREKAAPSMPRSHGECLAAYYANAGVPGLSGIIQRSDSIPVPDDEYMIDESTVQAVKTRLPDLQQNPVNKPKTTPSEDEGQSAVGLEENSIGNGLMV